MHLKDRTIRAADPVSPGRDVRNEQRGSKQATASEPHFRQLIGILRRRSKLIFAVTALGTILAGVAGLLITPKYTVRAQIIVAPQKGIVSPEAVEEAIDTHVTMLTSANHLQHVLDSLRNDPGFQEGVSEIGAGVKSPDNARSQSAAPAKAAAKPSETQAGPLSFKELKRRLNVWIQALTRNRGGGKQLTLEELSRNLRVIQEARSRVIAISFQWTSPEKAAVIANRIMELYVRNNTEQQRAYTIREMARLQDRMTAIKGDIDRIEAALHTAMQGPVGAGQGVGSGQGKADPHELERRAAMNAQLYASLSQRQEEIRQHQELIKPDADILSLASPPPRPSSPNPVLFMIPALMASLVCGCFLAVFLERLDTSLRCGREISDVLGISCIGLIPQIPRRHLTRLRKYLLAEPFSPYAEAIRSTVAMLRLAEPRHTARVVLVSSSIPEEGKTALAESVAAYTGLLGRRVLLVHLDHRQGSQLDEFDDGSERGSVDLSRQKRSPVESIRRIPHGGFDYLPLDHCLLKLFASEQLPGLIRHLRESYDCVIIDGPAVLSAVEARLLPSIADKLLFVVKWGSTKRELAQNALSLLRDSGCLGDDRSGQAVAILTQVDLRRHARYRYGDAGEFLVKNRNRRSRSIEMRPGPVDKRIRQSRLAALLHSIIPRREVKLQDLKIAPPSGPKATET